LGAVDLRDFIDVAARVMTASEHRLESIATNVSNSATPGFKRQSAFQLLPADTQPTEGVGTGQPAGSALRVQSDFTAGDLRATGKPLDLAIEGAGFFSLRMGADFMLTRGGQFRQSEDGRVISAQGYALQDAGGGDLIVRVPDPQILADGTVLEEGLPTGRIALVNVDDLSALAPAGGSVFRVLPGSDPAPEGSSFLRQGMLEGANVAMPAEMLAMMEAVRQAETGARLVQLYDTLMGRAITTFGQRG